MVCGTVASKLSPLFRCCGCCTRRCARAVQSPPSLAWQVAYAAGATVVAAACVLALDYTVMPGAAGGVWRWLTIRRVVAAVTLVLVALTWGVAASFVVCPGGAARRVSAVQVCALVLVLTGIPALMGPVVQCLETVTGASCACALSRVACGVVCGLAVGGYSLIWLCCCLLAETHASAGGFTVGIASIATAAVVVPVLALLLWLRIQPVAPAATFVDGVPTVSNIGAAAAAASDAFREEGLPTARCAVEWAMWTARRVVFPRYGPYVSMRCVLCVAV